MVSVFEILRRCYIFCGLICSQEMNHGQFIHELQQKQLSDIELSHSPFPLSQGKFFVINIFVK